MILSYKFTSQNKKVKKALSEIYRNFGNKEKANQYIKNRMNIRTMKLSELVSGSRRRR